MEKLQILNTRDVKQIRKQLLLQFGCEAPFPYTLLKSKQGRIYLASEGIGSLPLDELRVNSVGLYFGSRQKDGSIRLSVEGSQIIGPHATIGVVDVDQKEYDGWMRGDELARDGPEGIVIIRHGTDYAGTGFSRDGTVRNWLPKQRWVHGESFD